MNEAEFQELLKYQNFLAKQVVQEAKTDRTIKLLQLVNSLTSNGKKKVQTAIILHRAEDMGFSESEAYSVLDDLERDGLVIAAGEGYLKRT